nr:hypothetical protein [Streptomyces sp. A244]
MLLLPLRRTNARARQDPAGIQIPAHRPATPKGALSGAAETMSDAFQQSRDEGRQKQGTRPARR